MKTYCNSTEDRAAILQELREMPHLVDVDRAESCPKCQCSWLGSEIPTHNRHYYGPNTTHYSRLIGVEIPGYYDGVSFWKCPDCGATFSRF